MNENTSELIIFLLLIAVLVFSGILLKKKAERFGGFLFWGNSSGLHFLWDLTWVLWMCIIGFLIGMMGFLYVTGFM